MPFVRLSGAFSQLTGEFGRFEFKNGVSIGNLSWEDAEKLGATMRVFDNETDQQISKVKVFAEARNTPFKPKEKSDPAPVKSTEKKSPIEQAKEALVPNYTREQLEKIADESGLKGIREFAEKYNVRGTSIVGIIDDLMKKVDDK